MMQAMDKDRKPWSHAIAVDDIPEAGLHVELMAPEPVRAELAALAGIRELPQLSAVFDLQRQGAGVQVNGQVNARVGQICVVTLEPVENAVEETVDLLFAPQADAGNDREEPPEQLVGGKIDLGALATEFLLLGIDPYPRKAGAEFAPPKRAEPAEHPFAALGTLKKRLGGGGS
jgi:uncharacterized metal-binding protein YceD (DUF177 family)